MPYRDRHAAFRGSRSKSFNFASAAQRSDAISIHCLSRSPRRLRRLAKNPVQLRERSAAKRRDFHPLPFEIATPPSAAREEPRPTSRAQRSEAISIRCLSRSPRRLRLLAKHPIPLRERSAAKRSPFTAFRDRHAAGGGSRRTLSNFASAAQRRDLHPPPFEIATPPAAAREVGHSTSRAQRSDAISIHHLSRSPRRLRRLAKNPVQLRELSAATRSPSTAFRDRHAAGGGSRRTPSNFASSAQRRDLHPPPFEIATPPAAAREVIRRLTAPSPPAHRLIISSLIDFLLPAPGRHRLSPIIRPAS
ncbi:MAG: hypothetical protein HPY76_09830 [Anaerolineae bacterium]|nr:hypothetical protein [Anaerolineae bacterium]